MIKRYAIIMMGGQSIRFGQGDKCLALIQDKTVAAYSFAAFNRTEIFNHYFIVYGNDTQKDAFGKNLKSHISTDILAQISWIQGGQERTLSVWNALTFIHKNCDPEAFVFIHDGARPMITAKDILTINELLSTEYGIVLAHRVTDTTVSVTFENDEQNVVSKKMEPIDTLNKALGHPICTTSKTQRIYLRRGDLWALETPQVFYFPDIFRDYHRIIDSGQYRTDDSSIYSGPIHFLENDHLNLKITSAHDLELCRKILNQI
jgi:2-C-methyl-D-erythritol 4-phosphate cytidylyltransferase